MTIFWWDLTWKTQKSKSWLPNWNVVKKNNRKKIKIWRSRKGWTPWDRAPEGCDTVAARERPSPKPGGHVSPTAGGQWKCSIISRNGTNLHVSLQGIFLLFELIQSTFRRLGGFRRLVNFFRRIVLGCQIENNAEFGTLVKSADDFHRLVLHSAV